MIFYEDLNKLNNAPAGPQTCKAEPQRRRKQDSLALASSRSLAHCVMMPLLAPCLACPSPRKLCKASTCAAFHRRTQANRGTQLILVGVPRLLVSRLASAKVQVLRRRPVQYHDFWSRPSDVPFGNFRPVWFAASDIFTLSI